MTNPNPELVQDLHKLGDLAKLEAELRAAAEKATPGASKTVSQSDNAAYIALANPTDMIALIDHVRAEALAGGGNNPDRQSEDHRERIVAALLAIDQER